MNMPFYVSPEQLMKDRADYARKGIARGRSVVVLAYDGGIAFATENPSRALHKVSEIYDRIAFAAVGKYNEFENLRVAGVRYADLRGYSYDRADVSARALANAYAQTLGTVFTTESKPLEVELVVAEVGRTPADDQIYRLSYDGSVADEHGHVVMGGRAEHLSERLSTQWRAGMGLADVVQVAVAVLGAHPVYATAECDEVPQLVAHDRAGERVLEGLVVDAQQRLEHEGVPGTIHLFKNNTDSAGNSYGCHENYLVRRQGDFQRLSDILVPFFITRQILTGAGKLTVTPRGATFSLSQRAEHMWEAVSSATTRSRR